jgi:photosystem II stability/assembly factor-like uncharacterized protein
MKQLIVLLSFILWASLGLAQSWTSTRPGTYENIHWAKTEAIDSSNAWAMGLRGTFNAASVSQEYSRQGGVIAQTVDGGKIWRLQRMPGSSSQSLSDMSAFHADSVWLLTFDLRTYKPQVWRTYDGALTWKNVSPTDFEPSSFGSSIHFWDAKRGVLIGNGFGRACFEIFTTTNGGDTWQKIPCADVGKDSGLLATNAMRLATLPNGFAAFASTDLLGKKQAGRVYISKDFGAHWQISDTKQGNGDIVTFKNDSVGVMTFSNLNVQPYKCTVMRTQNSGASWEKITPAYSDFAFTSLQYVPDSNILVGISRPSIYGSFSTIASIDDGTKWTPLSGFQSIASIDFKNAKVGYAGSFKTYQNSQSLLYRFNTDSWAKLYPDTTTHNDSLFTIIPLKINTLQSAIYPNPFNQLLTFEGEFETMNDLEIRLFDIAGRQVWYKKRVDTEGYVVEQIPTGDLLKGVYILNVKQGENVLQKKVVKY